MIKAYAAHEPGGKLEPFEYDPGELQPGQVEIAVEYCGICHSDLSMLDNEWGMTTYPFVGGHEVVGTIAAVGDHVHSLAEGDRVGLGWHSGYCQTCGSCHDQGCGRRDRDRDHLPGCRGNRSGLVRGPASRPTSPSSSWLPSCSSCRLRSRSHRGRRTRDKPSQHHRPCAARA